jgi:methionine synthase I (cobalamin-dependent)
MHELNRAGMELAREAAGPDRLVLGDVGPSGAAPDRSLDAVFAEQIEALAEAGADGILIETIPSLAELEWAVRAARRVCALPLVASVFFVNRPHGPCTAAGEQCGLVARRAADWGADVVGANCGAGMRQLVDVLPRMRAVTAMPLAARPSAGLPRVQEGTAYYPESAADFTALLPELCRAGPVLVGGCCGTTPEHIRAIRTFVDRAAAPLCG